MDTIGCIKAQSTPINEPRYLDVISFLDNSHSNFKFFEKF